MAEDHDDKPAPSEGARAKDLLAAGELSSRAAERAAQAGEADPRRVKAKDLLRAGELESEDPASERFGRSFMERRYRRPVGNSDRLWKKVDGEDPWDLPKPKRDEKKAKQRGVYAAGRFVRVDKHEKAKERAKQAQIPEWAKKKPTRATPTSDAQAPEVKATPTAEDPLQRLMQIIAQKNAEAQTKIDKGNDAASRMKKKSVPEPAPGQPVRPPKPTAEAAPEPVPTPTPTRPSLPTPRKRASKTGRMRTSSTRPRMPTPAAPQPQQPQKPRQMAAGRAPPKPKPKPKDLPLEMRRPPRVDPHASAVDAPVDPRNRRMAAGRAPPRPRKKPTDLPLEMRRPPRIGPDGKPELGEPVLEIRRDSPAFNRPGKKTVSSKGPSKPAPAPASAAEKKAPETIDRTPPMPAKKRSLPKPKPPGGALGGGGGMDDLFGMAGQEGPMRIGRRKKKQAAAQSDDKPRPKVQDGPAKPPFPIPKVDYTPPKKGDKKDD